MATQQEQLAKAVNIESFGSAIMVGAGLIAVVVGLALASQFNVFVAGVAALVVFLVGWVIAVPFTFMGNVLKELAWTRAEIQRHIQETESTTSAIEGLRRDLTQFR